jgi:low temperature requirement protein LtrA
MSTAGSIRAATEGEDLPELRVTPLELFFDLVGMLEGAALLVVLWWAWAGYVWLTNAVPAEEVIPARLVVLVAMAAMLVASLAVPDAFGEYGVIFGLAYFVVRLLHVVLFVLASGVPPEAIRAMLRLAPGFLGAPCCSSRPGSRTASCRARFGPWRPGSTWACPWSAALGASGSTRGTSRSASPS